VNRLPPGPRALPGDDLRGVARQFRYRPARGTTHETAAKGVALSTIAAIGMRRSRGATAVSGVGCAWAPIDSGRGEVADAYPLDQLIGSRSPHQTTPDPRMFAEVYAVLPGCNQYTVALNGQHTGALPQWVRRTGTGPSPLSAIPVRAPVTGQSASTARNVFACSGTRSRPGFVSANLPLTFCPTVPDRPRPRRGRTTDHVIPAPSGNAHPAGTRRRPAAPRAARPQTGPAALPRPRLARRWCAADRPRLGGTPPSPTTIPALSI
jgi:hypothetical protein